MNIKIKSFRNQNKATLWSMIGVLIFSAIITPWVSTLTVSAANLQYAPMVEAKNITETTVDFEIAINPLETEESRINRFLLMIKNSDGDSISGSSGGISFNSGPVTVQSDSLMLFQGSDYTYSVIFQDIYGETISDEATGAFTMAGVRGSFITNVSFGEMDGKRIMNIEGQQFLAAKSQGFSQQIMTLNGQFVPFCASGVGIGEVTAEYLISILNLDPALVSETPACYIFMNESSEVVFTDDRAVIWLSDDFNITAEGTVSLLGMPSFTFNEQSNPVVSISEKTDTLVDGSIIESKPIFRGIAPPLSTVVVTVHSDPVTCTTTAGSNGNWSCTLPSNLPAGAHTVFVQVTTATNQVINLGPYSVTVQELTGILPPNTGIAPRYSNCIIDTFMI